MTTLSNEQKLKVAFHRKNAEVSLAEADYIENAEEINRFLELGEFDEIEGSEWTRSALDGRWYCNGERKTEYEMRLFMSVEVAKLKCN